MFNETELEAIAAMCETEAEFLKRCESRGVGTAQQQALVAAIRAKAIGERTNLAKAAAAAQKAEDGQK